MAVGGRDSSAFLYKILNINFVCIVIRYMYNTKELTLKTVTNTTEFPFQLENFTDPLI